MRKFYATIRRESKYFNCQQKLDGSGNPIPFEITLAFDTDPIWPVRGGVGGQYTLFDIDLWIYYGGEFEKLPIHQKPI